MFSLTKKFAPMTFRALQPITSAGFAGNITVATAGVGHKNGNTEVKLDGGKASLEVHSPLEWLLASLIACENKTLRAYLHQAKLEINDIKFNKCEAVYDTNFFFGKGEPQNNKFQKVQIEVEVDGKITPQQLEEVKKEVHRRCPVYNTFILAGIPVESVWKLKA